MFNVMTAHLLHTKVVKNQQDGGGGTPDGLNVYLFEGLILHEFSLVFGGYFLPLRPSFLGGNSNPNLTAGCSSAPKPYVADF